MITEIIAHVYCNNKEAEGTAYRIYVDGDLHTERTFKWPHTQNFILETLIADLQPGQHKVRVESLQTIDGFSIKSVTINGIDSEIQFSI